MWVTFIVNQGGWGQCISSVPGTYMYKMPNLGLIHSSFHSSNFSEVGTQHSEERRCPTSLQFPGGLGTLLWQNACVLIGASGVRRSLKEQQLMIRQLIIATKSTSYKISPWLKQQQKITFCMNFLFYHQISKNLQFGIGTKNEAVFSQCTSSEAVISTSNLSLI